MWSCSFFRSGVWAWLQSLLWKQQLRYQCGHSLISKINCFQTYMVVVEFNSLWAMRVRSQLSLGCQPEAALSFWLVDQRPLSLPCHRDLLTTYLQHDYLLHARQQGRESLPRQSLQSYGVYHRLKQYIYSNYFNELQKLHRNQNLTIYALKSCSSTLWNCNDILVFENPFNNLIFLVLIWLNMLLKVVSPHCEIVITFFVFETPFSDVHLFLSFWSLLLIKHFILKIIYIRIKLFLYNSIISEFHGYILSVNCKYQLKPGLYLFWILKILDAFQYVYFLSMHM